MALQVSDGLTDNSILDLSGAVDPSATKPTMPIILQYAQHLAAWPRAHTAPSDNLPLALVLRSMCQSRPCPKKVMLAALDAIYFHNGGWPNSSTLYGIGSIAPNLPIATIVEEIQSIFEQASTDLVAGLGVAAPQSRICLVHGCIAANEQPIVSFQIQQKASSLDEGYEAVEPADVVSGYESALGVDPDSVKTLHWLWRLQDDEDSTGVAWDIVTVGPLTLRAYVTTQQQYEPGWLVVCWVGFVLRLLAFIVFDVVGGSLSTKCEYEGAEGREEVEVLFLECFSSRWTWGVLVGLIGADI